jgi:hypothetical protein
MNKIKSSHNKWKAKRTENKNKEDIAQEKEKKNWIGLEKYKTLGAARAGEVKNLSSFGLTLMAFLSQFAAWHTSYPSFLSLSFSPTRPYPVRARTSNFAAVELPPPPPPSDFLWPRTWSAFASRADRGFGSAPPPPPSPSGSHLPRALLSGKQAKPATQPASGARVRTCSLRVA